MNLFVWKNDDGLHLTRPSSPSNLVEVEFDPDEPCLQCGEAVLSISADQSGICLWCASQTNRPKMLRYQQVEIIRGLQKQSDRNEQSRAPGPLIRNGGTEEDLRDYLTRHDYSGHSAQILHLELMALERPGWVQVFEFHVQAKRINGAWEELRGVCHTDQRSNQFDVTWFDSVDRNEVPGSGRTT